MDDIFIVVIFRLVFVQLAGVFQGRNFGPVLAYFRLDIGMVVVDGNEGEADQCDGQEKFDEELGVRVREFDPCCVLNRQMAFVHNISVGRGERM